MDLWKKDLEDNAVAKIESIVKERNFEKYDIEVSPASKKGDNYMGIVYRISVSGRKTGEDELTEWTFILKMCPSFIRKMPVDVIYRKELFAYTEMLPHFRRMEIERGVPEEERFRFTACLGGDLTPMKEFIALDDLRVEGFVMGSRKESLTHAQMRLLVDSLAHVHSFSFAMQKREPERLEAFTEAVRLDEEQFRNEQFRSMLAHMCANAVSAMSDDAHRERLRRFADGVWDRMMAFMLGDDCRPYSVLCHGDCWTNNVMFRFEDGEPTEVRLLDWQMVRRTTPVADLAYLMFCSTDAALRREHYESLLELYRERLALYLERLGCDADECYPEAVFRRHVAEYMQFGLCMAVMTAPMFMCDDDDVLDMNELMKKEGDFDAEDVSLKGAKSQARYEDRIRGVVGDFVRLGLI